jgi:hypothetical protein
MSVSRRDLSGDGYSDLAATRRLLGLHWQRIGTSEQVGRATAPYDHPNCPNPLSMMLAKAEVVVAAAVIAYVVTFVTARIIDRWRRY